MQIIILISFTLLITYIVILLYASLLKRIVFPKVNSNLVVILIWCSLLLISLFSDYLEIDPKIFIFVICALIILPFLYIFISLKKNFFKTFSEIIIENKLKIIGALLGMIILLLPLILFFPKNTSVLGNFVSNDGVNHVAMFQGYKYTRNLDFNDSYTLNDIYFRSIHSFTYYFSSMLIFDRFYYLIPISIFSYLFMLVNIDYLLDILKIKKTILSVILLVIVTFSPFLLINSIYLNFISQIASIPLLIFTLLYLVKYKISFTNVIVLIILINTLLATYSVLPVSIIVTLICFKILNAFRKSKITNLKRSLLQILQFKPGKNILEIIFILIILFVSIPVYLSVFHLISTQINNRGSDSYINSFGNLPGGFISPLHITGIWPINISYRDTITGVNMKYEYLLIALLILQVYLFLNTKKQVNIIQLLFANLFVLSIFTFIKPNPYIQFKLLLYLETLWLLFVGLSIYMHFSHKKIWVIIISIAYLTISIYSAHNAYKTIPVLYDFQMNEMKILYDKYINKGKTLVLTREDWVNVYRIQNDDYYPITQYLVKWFDKDFTLEKLDFVIIDKAYWEYIEKTPEINKYIPILNNSKCIENLGERFIIYKNKECS